MARPRKCRRVCAMPQNNSFAPIGENVCREKIVMRIEEYEAIRPLPGRRPRLCQEMPGSLLQKNKHTIIENNRR